MFEDNREIFRESEQEFLTDKHVRTELNKIDKKLKSVWKSWKAGIFTKDQYFQHRERLLAQKRILEKEAGLL